MGTVIMPNMQATPPQKPAILCPKNIAMLPIIVPGRLRPMLVMSSSSSSVRRC